MRLRLELGGGAGESFRLGRLNMRTVKNKYGSHPRVGKVHTWQAQRTSTLCPAILSMKKRTEDLTSANVGLYSRPTMKTQNKEGVGSWTGMSECGQPA